MATLYYQKVYSEKVYGQKIYSRKLKFLHLRARKNSKRDILKTSTPKQSTPKRSTPKRGLLLKCPSPKALRTSVALWVKRWPAELVATGSILAGGDNLFNCKQGSIAHSPSVSPSHRTVMTEILLKRTKSHPSIHPSVHPTRSTLLRSATCIKMSSAKIFNPQSAK